MIYEFITEKRQEESDTVDVELKKLFSRDSTFIEQIDNVNDTLKCHKNRLDVTSTRAHMRELLKEAFANSHQSVVVNDFL